MFAGLRLPMLLFGLLLAAGAAISQAALAQDANDGALPPPAQTCRARRPSWARSLWAEHG